MHVIGHIKRPTAAVKAAHSHQILAMLRLRLHEEDQFGQVHLLRAGLQRTVWSVKARAAGLTLMKKGKMSAKRQPGTFQLSKSS